ncbi:APC family permease [Actinoplanes utahensis]|uniref:Amino acid permease/ SLC12A domain-containing protein n=1 Tax=Actinoplanes utahensis TaxID=1869 RepID=A0A0A6ULP6_ACTUT|nr:APC family permease [Actinoplanes utahensis]KHD75229.1 hypothetical protein MB27_24405 [Actinoplanes utahensis]GIF28404.1 amino acid transporter [Actinoplanes utahensis]
MSTAPVAATLDRRTVTAFRAWLISLATSAPAVVMAGGIVATYAQSGVTSLPLLFLVIGVVVTLLMVGYSAMLREVSHSAPYYAILARGLSPEMGVAGAAVALLAYNTLQISLAGLFGSVLAGMTGLPWWVGAAVIIGVVALIGRMPIRAAIRFIAPVLIGSLMLLGLFVLVGISDPAGGQFTGKAFSPQGLLVSGGGLAVALTFAAFAGIDGGGSLIEEEATEGKPGAVVGRGMLAAAATATVVYTAVAWAMQLPSGPDGIAAAAANDANLPFTILADHLGPVAGVVVVVALAVFLAAIGTSSISLHSVITRYTMAIAREHVLPASLAESDGGTTAKAPKGASRLQTAIAVLVLAGFAIFGASGETMFVWLSTLGAMGLLVLLIIANVAAPIYFARNRTSVGAGASTAAPTLGVLLGTMILGAMLWQLSSLLPPSVVPPAIVPVLIVAAAVAGYVWARLLRSRQPGVYQGISHGVPLSGFDVPSAI